MANTLIAKIESLQVAIKGDKDTKIQIAKLKEANGKSFEWSTFHENVFDGYEVGDIIEIVAELKFKEGRKYPFRNIGSILGKREASEINTFDVLAQQPSQPTPATGLTSTNGTYDQGKAIERQSIERQTSVKLMGEIYKAGCGIDDLQMIAEAIVKAAETIETWLARQGAVAVIPAPLTATDAVTHANGASTTDDTARAPDSYKMETIGDLFTAVRDRYKGQKTIPDIFDALDVKTKEELLVNMTIETAWLTLQSIWEGPKVQESQPN